MSFRTRLTSFFVLIVVVPMVVVGVLVFRLISDSERGKADARANGLATAAASLYRAQSASASADARILGRDPRLLSGHPQAALSGLIVPLGLERATLSLGGRTLADVGDRTAVAPGSTRIIRGGGRAPLTLTVSATTAAEYVRDLASPTARVVVLQDRRVLASSLPARRPPVLPSSGEVTIAGARYRAATSRFAGFGGSRITVGVLSALSATSTSVGTPRAFTAAIIAAFLLLALSFSLLASRALQGQLSRFLHAARRLGAGDFSAPIETEGRDEFAALGTEFNNMSSQLATRLEELSQERARLRESIHRIGQTFAANLDRPALLELALKTALDAVGADAGRLSARMLADEPLAEMRREGSLEGFEDATYEAERAALASGSLGEVANDDFTVASIPLGSLGSTGKVRGVIAVLRRGDRLRDDDRELLRSLAGQAALALENVELHFQVRRQAVTDELTGLANHGRFQELLSAEMEQVRRYHYPVALIMLDIDEFKSVNDTYGHQQGDVVLRQVATVLRDTSREADSPARYGGEEMALILPHTDLAGAYAIAERLRVAVQALRIRRIDERGVLRVTASVGVAATAEGDREALIAEADAALYRAKRQGKNRTIKAPPRTANVFGSG